MAEENLLEDLLLAAAAEIDEPATPLLKETNIFEQETNVKPNSKEQIKDSVIHSGDTDSSDDEGNRNYEEKKYNDYGSSIKKLLNLSNEEISARNSKKRISTWKNTNIEPDSKPNASLSTKNNLSASEKKVFDVYTDPIFNIRIVNPLISSSVLQERMVGREAVPFSRISRFLQVQTNIKDKDWVIGGVIANKSAVKTSQKGSQFCIWTLTDLKDDIKTVSLFLFSSAHKQLWKTVVGTVVGILNPNVLDKKDGSKDEACLSVDNAQKIMIFGKSKDFGMCRSTKKNGEQCTAIVNTNRCEYCVYHIKQEYQKCSKRSELQANFAGHGLTALRNKVLGKNEVFYGGKSYMAIPAKRSSKLQKKDEGRLQRLSGINNNSNNIVKAKNVKRKAASRLDVSHAQRKKDIELLKKLGGISGLDTKNNFSGELSQNITLEESKNNALSVIAKLKAKKSETTTKLPTNSQYDAKLDLIVNLENKNNFKGNLSKEVSLDESKSAALNVIAKLKTKKQNLECDEVSSFNISAEDFMDELTYEDDIEQESKELQNISDNLKSPTTKINENVTNLEKPKMINNDSDININTQSDKILKSTPKKLSSVESVNKESVISVPGSDKLKLSEIMANVPKLSGFGKKSIDLSMPIVPRHAKKAKLNALQYIQKNGPLKKIDPNSTKGSGQKRPIEEIIPNEENSSKKQKIENSDFISDRFKKMMAATSKHLDLLEDRDNEEKDKYFRKLEVKEQMEEKMASTYKVACKAVKCLNCKYTSFSASDLCKKEKHVLRVFDAMKRFFKCGNCENRICCLEIVPTRACSNCGSGKWERTGMMKEKKAVVAHSLSIRGGEQKHTNSVIADANINLLVPDE